MGPVERQARERKRDSGRVLRNAGVGVGGGRAPEPVGLARHACIRWPGAPAVAAWGRR
jgi:hypothetical protein